MIKVGILNLQGAVVEHVNLLKQIPNVTPILVLTEQHANDIDGLIIPGGESTTMGNLLRQFNLLKPLQDKIKNGLPVYGTCAGMILLANKLTTDEPTHLGVMDIEVKRNAYGRQSSSFQRFEKIKDISDHAIPLVFIRAPYIQSVGEDVSILLTLDNQIVACRQSNMLVTSFHPELTDDLSMHTYFVNMIKNDMTAKKNHSIE